MKLKILVIGLGHYVCGNKENLGTIAPSIFFNSGHLVSEIVFISKTKKSAQSGRIKLAKIKKLANSNIKYKVEDLENKTLDTIIEDLKPDASIISIPDSLHAKFSCILTKRKIHCLVVKPMALKVADAKNMIESAEKNNVFGCVEFHKRFDEANLILKNEIQKHTFGDLLYAVINYSQPRYIPEKFFKKWAHTTDVFCYLGVHYVDLIFFLTNFKPKSVTSWGQKKSLLKNGIDTYDCINTVIEWEKKNKDIFISSHNTNWIESKNSSAISYQNISFIGTDGRVESDQKYRGIKLLNDKNGIKEINPYFSTLSLDTENNNNFFGYGVKSVCGFLLDVTNLLVNKVSLNYLIKNRSSFQNSILSVKVIEASSISLKQDNRKVKLD
tara:strand:+ start:249 stop:1400 length:1152 start_codon:yes stop_codon:yes gene_type:complete